MDLHPLLQQVLTLGRSADTPEERAIRSRVAAAELRLRSRTHLEPEWVDLSRSATERGEDIQGEWHGTTPQPQEDTPCASCDRHMGDDERFAFSGWIVHRRCAVESAEGAASRGDDRFGVAIRGGTGPPRRRTFLLAEIVPRIHLRYDRSTDRGTHQQRQLEILWRSLNSDGEKVANRDEGGQHVQGDRGDDAEASCTYCSRALVDSDGQSGDSHVRVPIPCTHGGFVHARCMLARADRIARGYADPRPCVVCQSAWTGGTRPPHPAE